MAAKTGSKYVRKRIEATLAKAGVSSWKGDTVYARLNHDRWLADCPCNGAELVTPGHTMLCGSCGAEHQVVFPDNPEDLEAVLAERDDTTKRNWNPGETVADLIVENIEQGVRRVK